MGRRAREQDVAQCGVLKGTMGARRAGWVRACPARHYAIGTCLRAKPQPQLEPTPAPSAETPSPPPPLSPGILTGMLSLRYPIDYIFLAIPVCPAETNSQTCVPVAVCRRCRASGPTSFALRMRGLQPFVSQLRLSFVLLLGLVY